MSDLMTLKFIEALSTRGRQVIPEGVHWSVTLTPGRLGELPAQDKVTLTCRIEDHGARTDVFAEYIEQFHDLDHLASLTITRCRHQLGL